ncbi:MAG: signal peptidase I [Candidatus Zambryskibacteria bacterium CG10_big_fil_rev_8_21_14_0_10_34_34]|uniref:Signal peptidase I n=1 Tax=Candidatus Zambryskibacteria bacterium CG10_big_fil_rev_8_21_14_0_10_34_34 TaxID=1975114 RepID=A0A2H0R179_9BACT|nr:MAG: signal peptidase I [Candidatus Zambryskibacteria bacterium CG10_big_fil_rev_8_21_14_0_10_34_34]
MEEKNKIENKTQKTNSFWELVKYGILALIIVVPFRIFIAQPYIVSGSSMDPTFKDTDYLIVDQLSKRFKEPERGDVLIIKYPKDPSKFFIKRLIGFPGETVTIKDGVVNIYNEENKNAFELNEPYIVYKKIENISVKLGEDEYFVMGDNRAGSSDSRIWGSLPKKYIVGKPILRLLPLNKIDYHPGLLDEK